MPAIVPSPINPASPSVPSITLSGGGATFAASGVSGCAAFPSGTDYACSGPWMIETQRLNIAYYRLPRYYSSGIDMNLSNPIDYYRVNHTYLVSKVDANYKVEKVYANYTTSAFTQPQTFEWYPASSDMYGNTYGAVGTSALGAGGNIQTQQEWYNRRPWVSGVDNETTQFMNNGLRSYGETNNVETGLTRYSSDIQYWGDPTRTGPSWESHAIKAHNNSYQRAEQDYTLPGPYVTSQENPMNIVNYINQMGNCVTNSLFYSGGLWSLDYPAIPSFSEGFSNYDAGRHGWV